jgi:peptidyl-prolyl cis-trans isomerase B (cyclophilin B)
MVCAALAAVFLVTWAVGVGYSADEPTKPETPKKDAPKEDTPKDKDKEKAEAEPLPQVTLETSKGKIVLELAEDDAPNTVANFVSLVEKKFYDGLKFHRVEPGFVIQGGDPKGNGSGGPGYTIPAEFSKKLKHTRGVLSMARTADPNSAGSQFFIMLGAAPSLDGQYAAFGKVISGMDVVDAIKVGDTITKATVDKKRNHPYQPKIFKKGD